MSREGWIVAVVAGLLLLAVPLAMCSGFSTDPPEHTNRLRPPDHGDVDPMDAQREGFGGAGGAADSLPDPMPSDPASPAWREVTGVVTDADGRPIDGAVLRREIADGNDEETTADDDGAFTLLLPVDAVEVMVEAFGYDDAVIDIDAGLTEKDIVLAPSQAVTGLVIDPAGQPVAGALVQCTDTKTRQARSDARGRFSLSGEPCLAAARREGFADAVAAKLERGPGNLLALRSLGSISGVVQDGSGAPRRGFVLSLHRFTPVAGESAKMRPYRQTFAHPQGRFVVNQLPAGTFVFSVSLRGRSPVQTQPIQLSGAQQLRNVVLVVD